CAANVTHEEELQTVWDTAVARFGSVDIWINNAGVGHPMQMVWELPQAAIDQVIDIDFKGLVYGSRVAIRNMLQQGHGHLYNMEGFGSNGRIRAGISVYGSTKAAVRFLSRSLTQETADTAVKVSTLSPGIVIT
ncbi:MAG: SDR family oxidoreductase, partial [Anaerolineales bacterium]|nr:SDR family oxidoreductase [Anaerolineales bacterium]